MTVKKISTRPFHNANKLNGQAARAKYGIFQNGQQVGVVVGSGLWEAYDMECKTRLLSFSCSSLKQLKECLAKV